MRMNSNAPNSYTHKNPTYRELNNARVNLHYTEKSNNGPRILAAVKRYKEAHAIWYNSPIELELQAAIRTPAQRAKRDAKEQHKMHALQCWIERLEQGII